MSSARKVFSEQEAGEIVRRAAALQEASQDSTYTPGITSEELRRIASEVGVDPRFLDQAIRESLTPEVKKGLFSLTEEYERVVDGELRQEDFDLVLQHLKPGFQKAPIVQVGRTLTGSAKSGLVSVANVKVTSRNGRTKLSVKSSPLIAYLIGLHPAVIGSFIAMGALGEQGLVAAGVATAAALLTAGGLAFKKLVGLGNQNARKLADELEQRISEETAGEPSSLQPEATPDSVQQRLGG